MPQQKQRQHRFSGGGPPKMKNARGAMHVLSLLVATVIIVAWASPPALARNITDNHVNYAYATWIGTGFYRIKDRRIAVVRAPISYNLREMESDEWGLDLLLPVTLGVDRFIDEEETVGSATFVPGLMFSYPVLENWWLKPYAQVGVAKDFSDGDVHSIYAVGIKSLARFKMDGYELELGNALLMADNSNSGQGGDNGFSMWEIGLNTRLPMDYKVQNKRTNLNIFVVYSEFINDLDFVQYLNQETDIQRLYKFGVALGVENNFEIWGFQFRGVGMDLTIGDGFTGFGLTTGFPF